MKRLICLLAIASILPCNAQEGLDGTKPLLVFRNRDAQHAEIVYTKPENIPNTDRWFPFFPINGDMKAQHYQYDSRGYFLKSVPVDSSPQVLEFLADIDNDDTIPIQVLLYLPLLQRVALDPVKRKEIWQRIISAAPASLTPQVRVKIEQLAAVRNMPLQ